MQNVAKSATPITDTIQAAYIGAGAAIFVGVLSFIVGLIVLWVQNRMAKKSLEVQERVSFLSLIERRAKWYDDAVAVWSNFISQMEANVESVVQEGKVTDIAAFKEIACCWRQARWLFGPEIDKFLNDLQTSIQKYSAARMRVREIGVMPREARNISEVREREQEFQETLASMMAFQEMLSAKVRPYLYVGDISSKYEMPAPASA